MTSRAVSLSIILATAEAHRKASRLAQADALCREILKVRPDHPPTLQLQALIAHDEGDLARAIELMQRAISLEPRNPSSYYNLAELYRRAGRLDEALGASQEALALEPESPRAFMSIGSTYAALGRHQEAMFHLQRAIAIAPNYALAHFNLGHVFDALGQFTKAIESKSEAARLDPSFPEAFCSRGITLYKMGCREEAQADWKRAIALNPSHADAHTNLAISELLRGNLAEGFSRYEWRWKAKDSQSRPKMPTPWKGEDLSTKQLLVHAEQGFGDAIQFCRYLPLLRERCAKLSLSVQEPLRSLIAHSMPWLDVCDGAHPPSDVQSTLLSLPHLFKTTLDTIPAPAPYMHAPADAISRLALIMGGGPELKVGLVWAGSPKHSMDKDRSIPFGALAPILAVKDVRFFSLQIGPTARDASASVTDLAPELTDFAQTAGAVANLDLVISVDTAVAHLAGAMGKPVWIMLPFVPDWRWLLEREDSPWYPTARLFRQKPLGQWGPVMRGIADALAMLAQKPAAARRVARKPRPERG
jgi:tetratricopeptide (TPR) repeat protein